MMSAIAMSEHEVQVVDAALAGERERLARRSVGKRSTMPMKMISETPLPMPLSVICSPSHIRKSVPATNAIDRVER